MTLPISCDSSDARDRLNVAYAELRRHIHTEPYSLAVKWLDALIIAQQAHMTSCNPAKLETAQGRVKLLITLRNAMVEPGGAWNGHMCD